MSDFSPKQNSPNVTIKKSPLLEQVLGDRSKLKQIRQKHNVQYEKPQLPRRKIYTGGSTTEILS